MSVEAHGSGAPGSRAVGSKVVSAVIVDSSGGKGRIGSPRSARLEGARHATPCADAAPGADTRHHDDGKWWDVNLATGASDADRLDGAPGLEGRVRRLGTGRRLERDDRA